MNIQKTSVANIICIAIVAVLAALLTFLGVLINNVSSDRWWQQFRAEEALVADQLAVSLALPLWNFDHSQMDKIMDSAMQNRAVFSIAVKPVGSNEQTFGRTRDPQWRIIDADKLVRQGDLLLQERDIYWGKELIGKVSVAVTPKFLEMSLKDNQRLILLILTSFLLILSSVLYVTLWRLVVVPLKGVESFAVAVSSGEDADLPTGSLYYGELENVRQSLTHMVAMLGRRYGELQSEIALRQESETRFRSLIDNAPLAIGIGRKGVNRYANDKYLKMFGFDNLDQIVGRPIADHWSPEWRALIDDRAQQRSMGLHIPSEYEAVALRADGSQFPAHITATTMDLPDGRSTVAFITDLTERKKLEEQLIQSQKMESIGRLAGGIAHDFNNLLTPIFGYTEMLKIKSAGNTPDDAKLDNIIMAADRARVLTQQLLAFSRKQVLEMKTLDLNDVVTSFYGILKRTVRENIDIRLHLTSDKLGIWADNHQLEQIIMNLVVNAQYAITGHGVITIETAPVTLDDEFISQHAVVKAGTYMMLVVTDNGCGMDNETLSHIFEPFFTTKGSDGSGLGLATVYGLVKQHNGFVWVYSEVGTGTAFKLYFPITDEAPPSSTETTSEQSILSGENRTILLVEDNEMVKNLVFDLLVAHGFTVLDADNPKAALEICKGRHIDLLVSDVVMPHMNGPDLFRRLLKINPDLKVLYMSGYTDNVIVSHGVPGEEINFIQKPFSVNAMASKIKEVLSKP